VSAEKFLGAKETPRPRNSTNKPPSFYNTIKIKIYQWRIRRRTRHAPKPHLKGTLHKEPHVKSEDLFMEK